MALSQHLPCYAWQASYPAWGGSPTYSPQHGERGREEVLDALGMLASDFQELAGALAHVVSQKAELSSAQHQQQQPRHEMPRVPPILVALDPVSCMGAARALAAPQAPSGAVVQAKVVQVPAPAADGGEAGTPRSVRGARARQGAAAAGESLGRTRPGRGRAPLAIAVTKIQELTADEPRSPKMVKTASTPWRERGAPRNISFASAPSTSPGTMKARMHRRLEQLFGSTPLEADEDDDDDGPPMMKSKSMPAHMW